MTEPGPLHTTAIGDRGSRVVFAHGLFGQGRNWNQIGKALADHHRVLLVDLPHHGRSAWEDGFDYLRVADQVAGLLDADDPAALVGHSLGGKVAMVLALRHPELVERLCVVDVSPVAYDHLVRVRRGTSPRCSGLALDSLSRRGDADAALAEAVPDTTVRSFLLQNLRRDGRRVALAGQPRRAGRGPPRDRWLAGAAARRCPAVPRARCCGSPEPGPTTSRRRTPRPWIGGSPRNRLVTIKDAGHWVHSEQPEVFLEVLRRFLDAARPRLSDVAE